MLELEIVDPVEYNLALDEIEYLKKELKKRDKRILELVWERGDKVLKKIEMVKKCKNR